MTQEPPDGGEGAPEEESLEWSDPRFWERALGAELAAWLLREPEVPAAIQNGGPGDLYALFKRKLADAPTGRHRDLLAHVLEDRRLFAEPIGSAPGMFTFNGIGTRCHGSQEHRGDGTYITTLFFTLVYLPIWPIRQYLVASAEGGGWHFLAKVRMSRFHRSWRGLVLVGAACAVFFGAFSAWKHDNYNDVHLLNGLDFPVTIRVDDEEIRLDSKDRATRDLAVGRHHVVASRADGTVVEERDVEVLRATDVLVYNVLGAAPLYFETVGYAAPGFDSMAEEASSVRSLAGDSWVVHKDVDVVFAANAETVSMSEFQSIARRTRVHVGEGGWRAATSQLVNDGKVPEAAALARRVALLNPATAVDAIRIAYAYSEASGDATATRDFVEELLAAAPESIDAHRFYQEYKTRHGALDEILPRYKAAYEKNPSSARDGYLYARIASFDEALPIYEALVPKNPDDSSLRRGIAWVYFQTGRFAKSIPHYEKLAELRPDEAGAYVWFLARALAGAGRHDEALAAVAAVLDAAPGREARSKVPLAGGDAWILIELYARLRRLVPQDTSSPTARQRLESLQDGQAPEAKLLAQLAASARDAERCATLYLRLAGDEILEACDLMLLSRTDVEAAAGRALRSSEETLARLDNEARVSIVCELARTGHLEKAKKVLAGLPAGIELRIDLVEALPDVSGLPEDLDVQLRAAMLYAASRRTDAAARREELLAEARRLDVLGVVVPD